jgi:DNA-binding NtrC family response regulator
VEVAVLAVQAPPHLSLQIRLDRTRSVVGSDPTADVLLPELPPAAFQVVHGGGRRVRIDRLDQEGSFEPEPDSTFEIGPYRFAIGWAELPAEDRARGSSTAVLHPSEQADEAPGLELRPVDGPPLQLRPGQSLTLGSAPENDLPIRAPHVSGFHGRLRWDREEGWKVVDLGSTNGTFLQGVRVQEASLPEAGTLHLADHALPFRQRPVAEPSDGGTVARAYHGMVGRSVAMQQVFDQIPRAARSDEPVLVHGESGSGKELVARAIHAESGRSGPFLALNCGALNPTLVESELFGHVKGAFTGAGADRKGAFEACAGGTLFLDEIGELPLDLQPKLLRVLESSAVRRIGDTVERPVDVRIVAATHRNLEEAVRQGHFREDLFHRLFVLSLILPPLRDRPEDVELLAEGFAASRGDGVRFSEAARARLRQHTWPGNVRELRNVVIRALVMGRGPRIEAEDLQFSSEAFGPSRPLVRRTVETDESSEKSRMLDALTQSGGNRSEAARLLGVSKSTFFDRLKRFGIDDAPT